MWRRPATTATMPPRMSSIGTSTQTRSTKEYQLATIPQRPSRKRTSPTMMCVMQALPVFVDPP
jgi:hypothetical protein